MIKSFSGTLSGTPVTLTGTAPAAGWVIFNDATEGQFTLTISNPSGPAASVKVGPHESQKIQTAVQEVTLSGTGAYRALCFQSLTTFRLFSVTGGPPGDVTLTFLPDDSTLEAVTGGDTPVVQVKNEGITAAKLSSALIAAIQEKTALQVVAGANLQQGDVVYPSGVAGDQLQVSKALATAPEVVGHQLMVMEEPVDEGEVGQARLFGLLSLVLTGTTPAVGDPAYVSDTATISQTAGTNTRLIGQVVSVDGSSYRVSVNGLPGGSGGSGAQVLLVGTDGSFQNGVDISDIGEEPIVFSDLAGNIDPGNAGAPIAIAFLPEGSGAAGQTALLPMLLKDSGGDPILAGGIGVEMIQPSAENPITALDLYVRAPGGESLHKAADLLHYGMIRLYQADGTSPGLATGLYSLADLYLESADGQAALAGEAGAGLKVGTSVLGLDQYGNPASDTNVEEVFEARVPIRSQLVTEDDTPQTLYTFGTTMPPGSRVLLTLRTDVMGTTEDGTSYIYANRVGRYRWDGTAWDQIGSTQKDINTDNHGGDLSDVSVGLGATTPQVVVTGLATTAVHWSARTTVVLMGVELPPP